MHVSWRLFFFLPFLVGNLAFGKKTWNEKEILAYALKNQSSLRVLRTQIQGAQNVWRASLSLPTNPVLAVNAGPRFPRPPALPSNAGLDLDAGLSWALPVGGRWQGQIALAKAAYDEMQALLRQEEWSASLLVKQAYLAWFFAEKETLIAHKHRIFFQRLEAMAKKREILGTATLLDVDSARLEVLRSQQVHSRAEGKAQEKKKALLDQSGWQGEIPILALEIAPRQAPLPSLDTLLALWKASPPPKLQTLAARQRRIQAEIHLAKAKRIPDLTLSLTYAHEAGEYAIRGGFQIPLPFFWRNQIEIAQKETQFHQEGWRFKEAHAQGQRALRLAHDALQKALATASLQEDHILPLFKRQEARLQRGFQEGSVALLHVFLLQGQLLEVQRSQLQTQDALHRAWLSLEAAFGRPLPVSPSSSPSNLRPPLSTQAASSKPRAAASSKSRAAASSKSRAAASSKPPTTKEDP